MFRVKRSDTKVSKIEATYGIDLNARGDMLLGNLLKKRGFDSQSQLLSDVTCQFTIQSMNQTTCAISGWKTFTQIMKKFLLILAVVVASSALFVSQAQAGQGKGHKHHKGHHAHHHHGKHHKA